MTKRTTKTNQGKMTKKWTAMLAVSVVGAALALAGTAPSSTTALSHGAAVSTEPHGHEADAVAFGPAPPVFPAGAEIAVLQGDPTVEGELFTVRLRFPDGYVIAPHWHPTDEHVTVISGTFLVGLGDTFDEAALLPPLESGDFITAPANANHFARAQGSTDVQIHAIGPFQMTYVDPADDPQNQ